MKTNRKLFILLLAPAFLLACNNGGGEVEPEPQDVVIKDEDTEHIYWRDLTSDVTLTGEGTEDSPYKISTPRELAKVAELVNDTATYEDYGSAYYELQNSIDLSDKAWTPIGRSENKSSPTIDCKFKGTFTTKDDKQFRIIGLTNLYMSPKILTGIPDRDPSGYGLFGYTYNAHIYNINVENCNIVETPTKVSSTEYSETLQESAPIVGWAYNGIVLKNCKASGMVLTGNSDCVSGLIGKIGNNSPSSNFDNVNYIIEDCETSVHVYADRTIKGRDYCRAGGFVSQINMVSGQTPSKVLFKNCISNAVIEAHGTLSNKSPTEGYGGIGIGAYVGVMQYPSGNTVIFDNCVNNAHIVDSYINTATDNASTTLKEISSKNLVSANVSDGGGNCYFFDCVNQGEDMEAAAPTVDVAYRKLAGAASLMFYIKKGDSIYKSKCEANFADWSEQTAPTSMSYEVNDGDIVLNVA